MKNKKEKKCLIDESIFIFHIRQSNINGDDTGCHPLWFTYTHKSQQLQLCAY